VLTIRKTAIKILCLILTFQMTVCIFPAFNSASLIEAQSKTSSEIATVTDDCSSAVSRSGVTYSGFNTKDFTATWDSTSPACPDANVLSIQPEWTKKPATATYAVNGATEVRVSNYFFAGSTAWSNNWYNQLERGYNASTGFEASKPYSNILMDPVTERLYVSLPGGKWAEYFDLPGYRFYPCTASDNTDPGAPTTVAPEDPSRLVPYGISIEYSADGTTWNYATKQIVNSIRAPSQYYFETFKGTLPDGVKYVRIGLNDRDTWFDVNTPNSLGNARAWNCGLGKVEIDYTVDGSNNAPVVQNSTYQGYKGLVVNGALSVSDADNDVLQLSITSNSTHGTVTLIGDRFKYTPNAGWSGTDSFKVKANDGLIDSNEGVIILNISADVPAVLPEDTKIEYPLVSSLTLSSVISDGMVLQRDKPIKVWGADYPGRQVEVKIYDELNNQVRNTAVTTGDDGSWMATFSNSIAGSFDKYKIVCTDGSSTKTINDVLFGDVWLSSGQSNMEMQTQYILGAETMLQNANNPNIRFLLVPSIPAGGIGADEPVNPQFDIQGARWGKGDNAEDVKLLSGVSYTFALKLFSKLNTGNAHIPIAILNTALGSTSIEAWTSRRSMEQSSYMKNFLIGLNRYYSRNTFNTAGNLNYNQTTAMFNSKIAPLTNMNIKGFIWYQGENNVGDYNAAQYYKVALNNMMADWSKWFGSETTNLPFVYAQIAPYNYNYTPESLTYFWEGMNEAWAGNPATSAQVPIYDLPLVWDSPSFPYKETVHPYDKKPVGERMSDAAWGLAYDSSEYTAPVYKSKAVNGSRIIATFDHVGAGLKLKDGDTGLKGFAICGTDRVFVNANARITAANTVEVWSDLVKNPVAVTYAFTDANYTSNLYNSINIAAAPFRSDTVDSRYFHRKEFAHCDSATLWMDTGSMTLGGADYQIAWAINAGETTAGNVAIAFDSTQKVEGNASLKLSYTATATNKNISISPNISGDLGKFNHLEQYSEMAFDVFNPDAGAKTVQVEIVVNSDEKYLCAIDNYNSSETVIPASSGFITNKVRLDRMIDKDGIVIKNTKSILADIKSISFVFGDVNNGTIFLDNIRFGTSSQVTTNNYKQLLNDKFTSSNNKFANYSGLKFNSDLANIMNWDSIGSASGASLSGGSRGYAVYKVDNAKIVDITAYIRNSDFASTWSWGYAAGWENAKTSKVDLSKITSMYVGSDGLLYTKNANGKWMVLYGEPYYSFRFLSDCNRQLPEILRPLVSVEYTLDGTNWISTNSEIIDISAGGGDTGTYFKEHLQVILSEDLVVKGIRVGIDAQRNTIIKSGTEEKLISIDNWSADIFLANVSIKGHGNPVDDFTGNPDTADKGLDMIAYLIFGLFIAGYFVIIAGFKRKKHFIRSKILVQK
jgi:hypothetical protein